MQVIRLTRKDTPRAKATLLRKLKKAHADKKNATLLEVSDGEEEIQAVIVPYHSAFSAIFERLDKSKGTTRVEFRWNDPELEAQLGLSAMQVNFSKDSSILLVDFKKKNQIIFAIVTKEFYNDKQ